MCKRFMLSDAKHKSGIIAEQIQRQKVEERRKMLPILSRDKHLLQALDAVKDTKAALVNAEKILDAQLERLGLSYDSYEKKGNPFYVANNNICLVPEKTLRELQKATDLHALGKKQEAQKIWDSIIKEYGLGA